MSDLIDRQKVIDVLNRGLSKIPYVNNTDTEMIRRDERMCCIQEVAGLPSVQPDVPDTNVGELISRQAAIDALDEQITQCDKALGSFDISMKDEYAVKVERASLMAFRETLEYMPSAQLERKKGKWIKDRDGIYHCSCCNTDYLMYEWAMKDTHYCPNCGCRMEEGDSDD